VGQDSELNLLESLSEMHSEGKTPSQRDLAEASGLSLGMTNALLRHFAERGWIKFSHLTGRSLQYALTPEGIVEVSRRAVSFFARAARNTSLYRGRINEFVREARDRGYGVLMLLGPAELDFLFDYSCERYGLEFRKSSLRARAASVQPDCVPDPSAQDSSVLCVRIANPEGPDRQADAAPGNEIMFAEILMGDVRWPDRTGPHSAKQDATHQDTKFR